MPRLSPLRGALTALRKAAGDRKPAPATTLAVTPPQGFGRAPPAAQRERIRSPEEQAAEQFEEHRARAQALAYHLARGGPDPRRIRVD